MRFDMGLLRTHSRYDPGLVYDEIFSAIDRTTVVIENKQLYATRLGAQVPCGFALEHNNEPYPSTRLRPLTPPTISVFIVAQLLSPF
jgi:hypothetical protein